MENKLQTGERRMNMANMKHVVEALLIATDEPLPLKKIIEIANIPEQDVRKYIDELNQDYHMSNRAFEIKEIAGGFQIYTLPQFADWVSNLLNRKSKLSKAALETLAIIAYHQPITRAEIEKLRGVDSTWVLDTLLQKGLIKTMGRLPLPGRPIKYGTTKEFLRYFGINDLNELPREENFEKQIATDYSDRHDELTTEPTKEESAENGEDTESIKTTNDLQE
jgi:segregation and condensation protein B